MTSKRDFLKKKRKKRKKDVLGILRGMIRFKAGFDFLGHFSDFYLFLLRFIKKLDLVISFLTSLSIQEMKLR